jgi:hypothetical protein
MGCSDGFLRNEKKNERENSFIKFSFPLMCIDTLTHTIPPTFSALKRGTQKEEEKNLYDKE